MFVYPPGAQLERSTRTRRRPPAETPDAAHRIFASATDALFLIDSDGRVTAWSPGAERLFQRRASDVLGRPATEVAAGAWADRIPGLLAAVLGGDGERREEVAAVRGDGTELRVDLSLSPVREGDRPATAIVGVAREDSERRRVEEAIRSREGRLVEVARMTTAGEILAGLAHEVNQPLTSIAGFAGACQNLMRSPQPDVERVRSHLRQIVELTGAAAEIVRRARRFVRRSVEPTEFDLGELARESVALLRFEETGRHVSVQVEAEGPVTVFGDRPHIEQVIVNLLRNAYESFAPDSRDRRVHVRVAAEGDDALVSVEDNGTGIGEEEARLAGTLRSAKEHGLGLGLGICRTILERHHGRFTLERAPGGGTIARFTLPLRSPWSGDA
jgi:PAS domain S-box-containing protein